MTTTSQTHDIHAPAVSIVLPAFNAERHIAQAIQSVLDQTFSDFELIIVNDGSTDATETLIQSFTDARVRYVAQDNQGPSAARNNALARCTGTHVAFLDADDFWYPSRLERQLAYVADRGVRAVFAWVDVIDEDSAILEASEIGAWFNRNCPSQAEMVSTFFSIGNFLCISTGLIERHLLGSVGDFRLTAIQAQDFDLWVRLVKRERIAILPEKLVGYRVRKGGSNLTYDRANVARIRFEIQQIYRVMFDDMPAALFDAAFPERRRKAQQASGVTLELEQAFLLLEHSEPYVQHIGLERLYGLMQDQAVVDEARITFEFSLPDLFALTRGTALTDATMAARLEKLEHLRATLAWHDEQRQNWQRVAEDREAQIAQPSGSKQHRLAGSIKHLLLRR